MDEEGDASDESFAVEDATETADDEAFNERKESRNMLDETGDQAPPGGGKARSSQDQRDGTSRSIVPTESFSMDEDPDESSPIDHKEALRNALATMTEMEKDAMLMDYEVEIKELESILEAAKSDLELYAEESSQLEEHIAELNDQLAAKIVLHRRI